MVVEREVRGDRGGWVDETGSVLGGPWAGTDVQGMAGHLVRQDTFTSPLIRCCFQALQDAFYILLIILTSSSYIIILFFWGGGMDSVIILRLSFN